MNNRLAFILGGPVLRREYRRTTRGLVPSILACVYVGWLFLYSVSMLDKRNDPGPYGSLAWNPRTIGAVAGYLSPSDAARMRWELNRSAYEAVFKRAGEYVSFLLHQQLLLILFAIPFATAGAIVYEKEKDTLQALFGTELSGAEIVFGKLLGRLAGISRVALAIVPALVFAAVLAEISMVRLLLALVQAAVLAFALAAGCMLLSLWTRRTSDAIIGSYSAVIVVYLFGNLVFGFASVPVVFDPLAILSDLLSVISPLRLLPVLVHLATWSALGILCCALVAARLRPVSLGLMEARPPRWYWALRPRIGNDPVRWREQHILGLAPIPVLRMVPRWMGCLAVLTVACVLAGDAFDHAVGRGFFTLLWRREFATARGLLHTPNLRFVWEDINVIGGVLLVLGSLTVGVRCAGSILEEKRRKTWEDLILTPLTMEEILAGKYRGIVQAAVVPLALYCLPMLALGALGGADAICVALAWMGAACIFIPFAGRAGMAVASGGDAEPGDNYALQTRMRYHRVGHDTLD